MKTLRKLDHTGDTEYVFDETTETADQLAEARQAFYEHVGRKLPAFQTKRADGKPDEQIRIFTDIEDGAEVILVPAIVAG